MINLDEIVNGSLIKICANGHETNCGRVGHKNKIGHVKSYCDRCYSKIDLKFTKDFWCNNCDSRPDPITLEDMMYMNSMRYANFYRNRKTFTKREQGSLGL